MKKKWLPKSRQELREMYHCKSTHCTHCDSYNVTPSQPIFIAQTHQPQTLQPIQIQTVQTQYQPIHLCTPVVYVQTSTRYLNPTSSQQCLHAPYYCQSNRHITYWCDTCRNNLHIPCKKLPKYLA